MPSPTELITINTDTVFDEDGVPVSIPRGARGRIVDDSDEVIFQVLIWWKGEGPEVLGVPRQHICQALST